GAAGRDRRPAGVRGRARAAGPRPGPARGDGVSESPGGRRRPARGTGRLRRAAALGTVVWVTLGPVLPADAAPSTGPAAAVPRRQPVEQLPVEVTIQQLDPRDVTPQSTIRVVARLRNTGSTPTGPLRYRLQRGALLESRRQLAEADAV